MRKVRTVVGLSLEQRLAVQRRAYVRGVSFAEALREIIDASRRLEKRRTRRGEVSAP